MKGFNFEKNLNHQSHAVDSTIGVFQDISLIQPTETDKNHINPAFDFQTGNTYPNNIRTVSYTHLDVYKRQGIFWSRYKLLHK